MGLRVTTGMPTEAMGDLQPRCGGLDPGKSEQTD